MSHAIDWQVQVPTPASHVPPILPVPAHCAHGSAPCSPHLKVISHEQETSFSVTVHVICCPPVTSHLNCILQPGGCACAVRVSMIEFQGGLPTLGVGRNMSIKSPVVVLIDPPDHRCFNGIKHEGEGSRSAQAPCGTWHVRTEIA
jgi:hypothetical protein